MVDEFVPPDGGVRACMVVIASFLCNGIIFGLINTYSVIYEELQTSLSKSGEKDASVKASLIGSLTIGTTFFLSMVSGILSDRLGIRLTTFIGGLIASSSVFISSLFITNVNVLILTYGVLFGIGASLSYIPSLTIIGHYFKKHIGIANGCVTVGSSVFSVAMPYILSAVINARGLQDCFRFEAILLSVLMLCSFVFKSPYDSRIQINKTRDLKDETSIGNFLNLSIWKNKRYVIWTTAVPLALCGYLVPYVHMVKFINKEFKGADAKLPVTSVALTSGIGRIIFGFISDDRRVNSIFLQQLSFLMIGIVSILTPLTSSYSIIIVLNLILGLFDGCFISVMGPIAFKLCGAEGASQAIGFILGFSSVPLIIGPVIAGWLFDKTSSYTLPFILAGIPPILGAGFLTAMHFMEPSRTNTENIEWLESKTLSEDDQLTKV